MTIETVSLIFILLAAGFILYAFIILFWFQLRDQNPKTPLRVGQIRIVYFDADNPFKPTRSIEHKILEIQSGYVYFQRPDTSKTDSCKISYFNNSRLKGGW